MADGGTINPRSIDRMELGFWRSYVHVGVFTYVLGGAATITYLLATPHGSNRTLLILIGISSVVASIGIFWWVGIRLVETKWRTRFFAGWTVFTFAFIATGAILDGGTTSPTSYFLVLPLLFAGLAYPPRVVSSLTGVAMISALLVGLVPSDRRGWSTVLLTAGMLVAGVLTTSTARHRQRLITALVAAASTDGLTGVLTRAAFYERLEHEAARARRYGGSVSVVSADLDNLKALNDHGGHVAGDEALREIAAALCHAARSTDFVGRLGGDEFALLLPGAGSQEAARVSERLLEAVRTEIRSGLTLSLGVAEWAGPEEQVEALMHRADQALYDAKRTGRDRFVVAKAVMAHPPTPGNVATA